MSVRVAERGPELLERSAELDELARRLQECRAGRGASVLVSGEAGIGKTELVRRFVTEANGSLTVLAGACEPLFTPRALGPLLDLAHGLDGELRRVLDAGCRPHDAASALLRDLQSMPAAVVVIEDLHWADDATLDVVKLLTRRIEEVPGVLICTLRDDELGRSHPLTRLLGEIAARPGVTRIRLEPLSLAAVTQLAADSPIDPVDLHRKTGGNPFFVTEVLAGDGLAVPTVVSDAVLARVAHLREAARDILETVALAPPLTEAWLLETVAPGCSPALDECLGSGMLVSRDGGIAFRHELARTAVATQLNPVRRRHLHQGLLAALAQPPSGAALDLTRLAHHADGAGNVAAVLRYAPAAGALASSLGSHREAASQYWRAIRVARTVDPVELGELYERHAHETYLTDQFDPAIASAEAAVESYRRSGDDLRTADSLRELTHLLRCGGRYREAAVRARQGLDLLDGLPEGPKHAMAYATQAFVAMNAGDRQGTFHWGSKAIDAAERTGAERALLHALNSVGTMEMLLGIDGGREKVLRSLEMALALDLDEEVGRAYLNFTAAAAITHQFVGLHEVINAGLEYCSQRGLDLWAHYLLASRAYMALEQGAWAEAIQIAGDIVRRTSTDVARQIPQLIIAVVRSRRGDPDWESPLAEARATGLAAGELQAVVPTIVAEAEIAWLRGRSEDISQLTSSTYEWARREADPWSAGALAVWRRRAGIIEEAPDWLPVPHARELAGDAAEAHAAWTQLGCPYEAALALASAADSDLLGQAHTELLKLGARATAAVIARRLREEGTRKIARGPRATTLENPAGLTVRELEVAKLLSGGMSNAAIAKRLFLSPKTVDHHVSAILTKLDARTRGEAAARLTATQR